MSLLSPLAGLTGLVTAAALVAVPVSPAVADSSLWCSAPGASTPCILSVTHDGTPVPASDPVWQIDWAPTPGDDDVRWVLTESGSEALTAAAAGRWEVSLDLGTFVPRVVYGTGRNGQVTRLDDGDGTYRITMSAEPVLVASGCVMSDPWVCPDVAESQAIRLGSEVHDWDNWTDPVQRAAFYGVDFWTNVETTSFPPGVIYNDDTGVAAMRLDLAAPHFETDGTTVHRGHFEARLPNAFLRENFFIPDPTTMTPASLAVAGGGPTSTTTVRKDSASASMEIDVTDMTFSIRKLRVRTGTVVPTRPANVRAARVSRKAARLGYALAKPRGAKVTGYQARCVSPAGTVVKARRTGNDSPLRVTGLKRGARYDCKVRATSKVGPGPWSAKVGVPRRP